MTKRNVLIIGAGGVAHVAAHKAAMHNDELGDICIASRHASKCEAIIDSVVAKGHLRDPSERLTPRSSTRSTSAPPSARSRRPARRSSINLGTRVRQHGGPRGVHRDRRRLHRHGDPRGSRRGLRRPAVVRQPRVEASRALRRAAASRRSSAPASTPASSTPTARSPPRSTSTRSTRSTSSTSTPAATAGTSPPTSTRRSTSASSSRCGRGSTASGSSTRRTRSSGTYDFPVVGEQPVYLTGHDELHSLSKNIDANSIRFWMGFGDHYINVFTVLRTLGLLSHQPVHRRGRGGGAAAGRQGRAARSPDAGARLHRQDLHRQHRHGPEGRPPPRGVHLPGVRPRRRPTPRSGSQGISYTAGVPPVAAARLIAAGDWDAAPNGQRRGARPRAVPRPARPDGPPDRDARDRSRRRRPTSTAPSGRWRPRSTTPSSP